MFYTNFYESFSPHFSASLRTLAVQSVSGANHIIKVYFKIETVASGIQTRENKQENKREKLYREKNEYNNLMVLIFKLSTLCTFLFIALHHFTDLHRAHYFPSI